MCTATLVLANYSESRTATCYASGSAWTYWWNHGAGGYSLHGDVANPAYYS
jgi:hypothetical protein